MAIVEELFADRTETVGTKPSAEIAYVVSQAIDENDVKNAADASIPDTYAGLFRTTITIDERINEYTWKVIASFEAPDFGQGEDEEEPVFSFDTGGGTQHISQSIQTVAKYGPQASDLLGGAIGYDGENIAGVDITIPVFNFTETHFLPDSTVTPTYKWNLFKKTGNVNSATFRGLSQGEVLFLGAAGSKSGNGDWEITFRFAALPNKTNIQVGDITGISKKGWEYLWVQYADDVDTVKKQIIKKPVAVYVEKLYEETSFSGLGIGS
jgi:hypothetical protein